MRGAAPLLRVAASVDFATPASKRSGQSRPIPADTHVPYAVARIVCEIHDGETELAGIALHSIELRRALTFLVSTYNLL